MCLFIVFVRDGFYHYTESNHKDALEIQLITDSSCRKISITNNEDLNQDQLTNNL